MTRAVLFGHETGLMDRLGADLEGLGLKPESFLDIERGISACADGDAPDLLVVSCRTTECSRLVERLHQSWQTEETPILLVVGSDADWDAAVAGRVSDIILADYDPRELAARVKLILSRSPGPAKTGRIVAGELVIDPDSFEVRIGGRAIPLTYREYELLRFLAQERARVFTRKTLVEKIWEYDYLSGTRTVDVHVRRLRAKLGPRYGSMIETVRNVGYRFSRHDPPKAP